MSFNPYDTAQNRADDVAAQQEEDRSIRAHLTPDEHLTELVGLLRDTATHALDQPPFRANAPHRLLIDLFAELDDLLTSQRHEGVLIDWPER